MRIELIHHEGFTEFGEAGTGGGHDWSVFGVWLKDGVFYWAEDSGCSCNGPYDYLNDFPNDFSGHGSAHEAVKALHAWTGANYTVDSSDALLSKLLTYNPKDAK